jgi:uncharacterized membrane protein
MEKWVLYSLFVVIIYAIWTLIYEEIIKKHDNCFCMQLKIFMIVGILAFLYFLYHIQSDCNHGKTIKESLNALSKKAYIYIIIIAMLSILANKFILKAITDKGNSGYVYSVTNIYIVIVTFASAYLYNTQIKKKDILGVITIIAGSGILLF